MDGTELLSLMTQRYATLCELKELSHQQAAAIAAGQMGELMRILSRKQQPIARLTALARQLNQAADDDPDLRDWTSAAERQTCRQTQQQCEQLHVELLALETASESALQHARTEVEQQLGQLDASHQASQRYLLRPAAATVGTSLDLSE